MGRRSKRRVGRWERTLKGGGGQDVAGERGGVGAGVCRLKGDGSGSCCALRAKEAPGRRGVGSRSPMPAASTAHRHSRGSSIAPTLPDNPLGSL